MFLTAAELYALTGRRRARAQAEWLRARRIRHYVNARGCVVVARAWIDAGPEPDTAPDRVRPNLDAIRV